MSDAGLERQRRALAAGLVAPLVHVVVSMGDEAIDAFLARHSGPGPEDTTG